MRTVAGVDRAPLSHVEDVVSPVFSARIRASIPMGRPARAEEVAAPIAWLLGDDASFVSGACLDVSGGGFVIGSRA
jgi:NAD(P)-dependent dehydrogenase (short-subunit alcohol dehydrogenase family)